MQLSVREKYCYGIGAFGKDLVYTLVASYFMIYLTDGLSISPLFVGGLFFVARLWDAINDPLMGWLVDSTRTRFGKFRPWLVIGTVLNAICLIFLFFNPSLEGGAQYGYIAMTYLLWGMTYTIMDIPYWAFIPAMTQDEAQRNELSVIPRVFASIGMFLVASGGILFVNEVVGDYEKGFFYLACLISVVFVVCLGITVLNVKETPSLVQDRPTFQLRDVFKTLIQNDQLIALFVTIVLYSVGMYLTTGMGFYYFKYQVGDENLYATFTLVAGVAQVLAMLLFPMCAKKVGRHQLFKVACVLPLVGYGVMFMVGQLAPMNMVLLSLAGVILFLGFGCSQVLATTMLADVVDYGEYKLGYRTESIVFSMQPFMVKFSSALQGLLTGIGLTLIGYQENMIQTSQTLAGMNVMMFVVPSFFIVAALLVYFRYYRLTGAFYQRVMTAVKK